MNSLETLKFGENFLDKYEILYVKKEKVIVTYFMLSFLRTKVRYLVLNFNFTSLDSSTE